MITLSKIAKLAHVSVSTVSKAFSMSKEVNSETRELIFKIAREHHCFKKYYNAKYPKLVLAVICPEFESLYYADWLSEIQRYTRKYNCEICVASTNFDKETEQEIIEYYSNYTAVDGIIIIQKAGEIKNNTEIPIVSIGNVRIENESVSIHFDFDDAFEKVIDYFKENGIKKIGYLGENHTIYKKDKICNLLGKKGLEIDNDIIVTVPERFENGGYIGMKKILETGKIPRALVCAYDSMAIGAMRYIKEAGLNIPEDIAIIGIDNIEAGKYITPSLSSMGFDMELATKTAVDNLINVIKGKPYIKEAVIKSEVYMRETTKMV